MYRVAESEGISIEEMRVLVRHADLDLTDDELERLKPLYEHFARQAARLRDLDLGVEDLAVAFSPNWAPPFPGDEEVQP